MEAALPDPWEDTQVEHEWTDAPHEPVALEAQAAHASIRRRLFGEPRSQEVPSLVPSLGRFEVVRQIGSGAMGVVFEGIDPSLGRRVALKVLRSDMVAHRSLHARARMLREAQALARLRHPNVTAVYEVGTSDAGAPFIAMELVEGRTLRSWLRARPRSSREILDVFLLAGRGLAAAHRVGLVHRDIKPANILVDAQGQPRVVDFGLARAAGLAEHLPTLDEDDGEPLPLHLTCTGTILGTPAYMAPEQFEGGPAYATSDQFSFCVTLFEALYGRRPYPGNDLAALRRSLVQGTPARPRRGGSRRLYRVLCRGLAIAPSKRYPSMDALLDALEACMRPPRVQRTAVLVAGLALAAAAGALLPSPSDAVPAAAACVTPGATSRSSEPVAPMVARAGGWGAPEN